MITGFKKRSSEKEVDSHVRRDTLPENVIGKPGYRDDGCRAIITCLACPLIVCLEEWSIRDRLKDRNAEIVARYNDGAPAKAIAEFYGISDRTVFKVVAKAR